MSPHRTTRKAPETAPYSNRRRVTRQASQSSRHSSVLPPPVNVKTDHASIGRSASMSGGYSAQNGHSQIRQPSFGGGQGSHASLPNGLHTPQQNHSFSSFGTPVDLTGATLLGQNEYQNLTAGLSSSDLSSYRQSSGHGGPNGSFTIGTPQNDPFTSSIDPRTPSGPAMTPEARTQPPPPPRGPFPGFMSHKPAIDVVPHTNSDGFRLDSTVCKKLAVEPAIRTPEQRNPKRVLNMARRGNAEALLCQIAGQEAANSCKNCKRGHGPWSKCVVFPNLFYGSCSNCWFNASGARCTFQESNHHPLHQIYAAMAPAYNNPFPPATTQSTNNTTTLPYGTGGPVTQNPSPASSNPYVTQPGAQQSTYRHREGLSLNGVHFNRPIGASNGSDGGPVIGSTHPADDQIVSATAARDLSQGVVGDSVTWGIRARHLIRIQAAASELGMRLGEYDEFLSENGLGTPEAYMGPAQQHGHNDAEGEDDDGDEQHRHDRSNLSQREHSTGIEKHDSELTETEEAEGSEHIAENGLHELQSPSMG